MGRIWGHASSCHSSVALLDDEYAMAVRGLLDRWDEVEGLELTDSLARRAGELAELCALRGYDAIHLASAEAILDDRDVMVVFDTRLAEAAASIGIEALVPTAS